MVVYLKHCNCIRYVSRDCKLTWFFNIPLSLKVILWRQPKMVQGTFVLYYFEPTSFISQQVYLFYERKQICIRPLSHWSDATVIRLRKNHFTVVYWSNLQFVMALLPPARPRCDDDSPWISVVDFFLDRIAVASPQWENDLRIMSVDLPR
jgi:hypothetical protein